MSSPNNFESTTNNIANDGSEDALGDHHPLIESTGNDATAEVHTQPHDPIVDGGEHANPNHAMRNAVVGAAIGCMAVLAVGHCAAAAVPAAMSYFGTVVPGVGTIHASFATGGAAATLQVVSAKLLSGTATTVATTIGGILGSKVAPAT